MLDVLNKFIKKFIHREVKQLQYPFVSITNF